MPQKVPQKVPDARNWRYAERAKLREDMNRLDRRRNENISVLPFQKGFSTSISTVSLRATLMLNGFS